jgi:hypothetical protein
VIVSIVKSSAMSDFLYLQAVIDSYSFGSMTIQGQQYRSDLKIINGEVVPNWWSQVGHTVDVEDVTDILNAAPDYLVIGSGKMGLVKVRAGLKRELADRGIEVVVERSRKAVETFNRLYGGGKNAAGGFDLTC